MKEREEGKLIVISGPSGAGKSTVISRLLKERENIHFSVSFTTRAPRVGEIDGVNYNFVSRERFEEMIAAGDLLEYTQYINHYYGTSLRVIEDYLQQGIDVLLDIEVDGAAKVRTRCPYAVSIFIIPPSFADLEQRLRARDTDDEAVIQNRLLTAREEYGFISEYDYLVVNDEVETAVKELHTILNAESYKTKYRLHLTQEV